MHRTDGLNNVAGAFDDGDVGTGTPGTQIEQDWLNAVQEELCAVVETCGGTLVKGSNGQVVAQMVSAATANKVVRRDSSGRAKVADPSAADDIDTKGARDTAVNAGPSVVGTATAGSNWSITGGSTAGKRYANKLVSLECFVSVTNTPPGTSILTLSDSLQPASNVEAHVLARLQRGASWFVVGVLVNGSSSALQVDDSFTYQTGDVLAVSLMYRGA